MVCHLVIAPELSRVAALHLCGQDAAQYSGEAGAPLCAWMDPAWPWRGVFPLLFPVPPHFRPCPIRAERGRSWYPVAVRFGNWMRLHPFGPKPEAYPRAEAAVRFPTEAGGEP